MTYFKIVGNNYINAIGKTSNYVQPELIITEDEYNNILNLIRNKLTAPEGYDYRLRADTLEWELYELPPMPEYDEEATTEDYEAALAELGVR